mgnify:CR=1 FL=1
MENQNIVLTRDKLLEEIWGYDFDGETKNGRCPCKNLAPEAGTGRRIY